MVQAIYDIQLQGNHITQEMSFADLIQLGGYAAVEYCGGPQMIFKMGRMDIDDHTEVVKQTPQTLYNGQTILQLSKLGLAPEDYVALIGGTQTIGFHSDAKKGPQTRWTMNPYVFDNTYFKE